MTNQRVPLEKYRARCAASVMSLCALLASGDTWISCRFFSQSARDVAAWDAAVRWLRKAERLMRANAAVTVVAPELRRSLVCYRTAGKLAHRAQAFRVSDIESDALVIAAPDDAAVSSRVSGLCRERAIPTNVVDGRELCGFSVPSIIDWSPVTVALPGGSSPALSYSAHKAGDDAAGVEWHARDAGARLARACQGPIHEERAASPFLGTGAARPLVMLTTSDDERERVGSLRCGAQDYFLKDMEPEAPVLALHEIRQGKTGVIPALTTFSLR
jgi:hypothetical protein